MTNIVTPLLAFILLVVLTLTFFTAPPKVFGLTSRVDLLTTDDFAVLGGSGITNTGPTTITGDIGTFPTTTENGLGSVTLNGTDRAGGAVTQGAKDDLVTAYNDAAGRSVTSTTDTELGGKTLTDGVYDSAAGTFGITGTLTLNGEGNADAVFIFKMASTLITASSSKVVLINSAQSCNVYWQVGSSATLDTSTDFIGNILALASITLKTNATVDGRVLARDGAVTLDTNTITKSTCAPTPTTTPTPTPTPTSAASSTSSSGSSSTGTTVYPALSSTIIAPIIIESKRIDANSIFIGWGPYSGTDKFIVQYGLTKDNWLYNTNVTGFSTTINAIPSNQPIWVEVAARNDYLVGTYGASKLVGGPKLPSTGLGPQKSYIPWYISAGVGVVISVLLVLIQKKHRFLSRQ